MPKMKIEMNNNLLTQTIEKSKRMENSEQTVKLIFRVIESKNGECFAQRYFMHR